MSIDIDALNESQRDAVLCTEGPLLVLAGAGSGKTRVLTHRIAHLIEDLAVAPWSILAITFTNKAAREMRERLGLLIGESVRGMWVSTFHSMCVRILRTDAHYLGFTQDFTIYDADDAKRLCKEILAELNVDDKRFPISAIMHRISEAKNNLITPSNFQEQVSDPVGKVAARVYVRYQERLQAANALDFDDLLFYAYTLLQHHEEVLHSYQQRFRYILVDEYQDTNAAQYAITRLLAQQSRNVMVVGDDDQSIYSWRGADIRNILEFETDYPDATVVKLEQNYRSVGNVLAAANAVIANNTHRKHKKLFTTAEAGEKIAVYLANDERDEGRWIAGEIEKLHGSGASYDDIAVFYRTNAQSRSLEDMMLRAGVPYRIVGGVRFFDRAEIRDVMAYLTLAVNPADDLAAKRVINIPKRGIGKTSIAHIEEYAHAHGFTFLQASKALVADSDLRMATRRALGQFVSLIDEARTYTGDLRCIVEAIIEKTGYLAALEAQRTDDARTRIENVREFLSVVDEFAATHKRDGDEEFFAAPNELPDTVRTADQQPDIRILHGDSLADFIEWVRLRTDLDALEEGEPAVVLMTIHASKGLEFNNVFVAGMEEGLFPHTSAKDDPIGLEEERRLAYVAITRARKRLFLTCASSRQIFGVTQTNPTSRFLSEIPATLKQTSGIGSAGFTGTGWEKRGSRRGIAGSGAEAGRGRVFNRSSASGSIGRTNCNRGKQEQGHVTNTTSTVPMSALNFTVGDRVDHKTFGRGLVVDIDGDRIHVIFDQTGQTKKLLRDYAPLIKLDQNS